jgi:hypothetical protein
MKHMTLMAAAVIALAVLPGAAEAKGCIKGAIVGGIAGHYAGHHGFAGAAAGCIIGHHNANRQPPAQNAPSSSQSSNPPK